MKCNIVVMKMELYFDDNGIEMKLNNIIRTQ
jgi:hypothetical protein